MMLTSKRVKEIVSKSNQEIETGGGKRKEKNCCWASSSNLRVLNIET